MMTGKRSGPLILLLAVFAAAVVIGGSTPSPGGDAPPTGAVKFTRVADDAYQNFLVNWDDAKHPLLLAVVRDAAEYDQLFHPALVIGKKRPFAPPAKQWEQEQLVVMARVIPATGKRDQVLEVEQVTADGPTLTVRYKFRAPAAAKATSREKIALQLRIPRAEYDRVVFIENGKPAGELHLCQDEWARPEPARQE